MGSKWKWFAAGAFTHWLLSGKKQDDAEYQEKLEKEFLEKGVKIVKPLNVTDYKNKEFVIEDIDGRWIAFGLKIKD